MLEERSDEEACEGVGEHRDGPPRVRQETPDNEPAARRFRRDRKRRAGIRRGRRARQARPAFDGGRREGRSRRTRNDASLGESGRDQTGREARDAKARKPRKPNFVTRTVNHWCNRLLGAVSERSLAAQEEQYAAHRTTRDYVWNYPGHRRMGHGVPRAHRGGHAAGGRGAGRHVLAWRSSPACCSCSWPTTACAPTRCPTLTRRTLSRTTSSTAG